jgi:hypothetical protein
LRLDPEVKPLFSDTQSSELSRRTRLLPANAVILGYLFPRDAAALAALAEEAGE